MALERTRSLELHANIMGQRFWKRSWWLDVYIGLGRARFSLRTTRACVQTLAAGLVLSGPCWHVDKMGHWESKTWLRQCHNQTLLDIEWLERLDPSTRHDNLLSGADAWPNTRSRDEFELHINTFFTLYRRAKQNWKQVPEIWNPAGYYGYITVDLSKLWWLSIDLLFVLNIRASQS